MEERHVGGRHIRHLGLIRHGREAGGQALKRPASLGGVLDHPHAHRQVRQLLIGSAHHDHRPVDCAGDDPGHAMEQRGAVPFEACLGPAHASGAAPGQYDTGYRTHAVECTYLHKRPNPQGGQTPLRVCYLDRHVGRDPATGHVGALEREGQRTVHRPQLRAAVADRPRRRPAAHIGVLERDHQRLRHDVRAALSHRPALPEAHHAVVGGHDLVHLRVVDLGHALHLRRE